MGRLLVVWSWTAEVENADIAPGDNDPDKMRRENFIREGGPWTGSHGGSEGISGILFLIFLI